MKLHSSLTAYLGGILILITSYIFISHRYQSIGIILSAFFTILISAFLYFAYRLVAQKINNIFVQMGIFIIISSIVRILSNIGEPVMFKYYLTSYFSLNTLIWLTILIAPSFIVFQILKRVYYVEIINGICEFQNFWGESGTLELENVRILEHKIIPFFIPFLTPGFLFGKFKMASITWEDDNMEPYSISFINKKLIEGIPVLDHLSNQAIALGNINIRRY